MSDSDGETDGPTPHSIDYVKITPSRDLVNSETITREFAGIHKYGKGRKLPLDMDKHFESIKAPESFEFLIHKPADENRFNFYFGTGNHNRLSVDKVEGLSKASYPDTYEFEHEEFDITSCFDDTPNIVRFEGVGEHRHDWMTTISKFDTETSERAPLANLLESAIQIPEELVFQVVFEPRDDWSRKAQRMKGLVKRGTKSHTGLIAQTALDALAGSSDHEQRARNQASTPEEIGGSVHDTQDDSYSPVTGRMRQIDEKRPSLTYNTTVRLATESDEAAHRLEDTLAHLSGNFYMIHGNHLGQDDEEYERLCNHEITYPMGYSFLQRKKPMLVLNIKELANFVVVPSIDMLPRASRGGTGGRPAAQSPLTSPNEEVFDEFEGGMAIGHVETSDTREQRDDGPAPDEEIPIDGTIEERDEWLNDLDRDDTVSLDADQLTRHYMRAGTTGSGKTVATINDMLTCNYNLEGPTVLLDPKNGEMCDNYLRAHKTIFGDLEDVEYIKIPEQDGQVPGIPFFDVRPLTRGADKARATAVQDIIDHYFQLLKFILGKNTVEQAFVANEIIKNLIKALFDEEHGSDSFAIGDLLEAAQNYQHYGREVEHLGEDADKAAQAIPKTGDEQVRAMLESHLEKDERQFINTTDAVLNRIRKLKEKDFIWDMLSFSVGQEHWNDRTDWYDRDAVPMLDMKELLNSNKVLLVDTGELRSESSETFGVLFLSYFWTAVQSLWTPDSEDHLANLIIEESANIARNEIVYRELLPKGREFDLSLGLVMQYPGQVLGNNPRENKRAYQEIINNINTHIISNISTDDELASSLFHEALETEEIQDRISGLRRGKWIVQLPSSGFNREKPEVLSLNPLPIPPGHSASAFTPDAESERVRKRSRARYCVGKDSPFVEDSIQSFTRGDDDDDTASDGDEDLPDMGDFEPEQVTFMQRVIDALTDGAMGYNLSQSMNTLQHSSEADELVEDGYLEKEVIGNRKTYYWPTDDALTILDDDLKPEGGGEHGNESREHRIGVRLLATYWEELGYDVSMYEHLEAHDARPDVYAEWTDDVPERFPEGVARVGEVECSPGNSTHVMEDFETMMGIPGRVTWVTVSSGDAKTLIEHLAPKLRNEPSPSALSAKNISRLSEDLDSHGAYRLKTIPQLQEAVAGLTDE